MGCARCARRRSSGLLAGRHELRSHGFGVRAASGSRQLEPSGSGFVGKVGLPVEGVARCWCLGDRHQAQNLGALVEASAITWA